MKIRDWARAKEAVRATLNPRWRCAARIVETKGRGILTKHALLFKNMDSGWLHKIWFYATDLEEAECHNAP